MKKLLIIVAILAVAAYLLITLIPKRPGEENTSTSDFSTPIVENKKNDNKELESDEKDETIIDNDVSSEEEQTNENVAKEDVQEGKQETIVNSNDDKTTEEKQNEDEFYDTSDRDPFAEEQHKTDVPLVLVDKDGNEMQPETVYWDEESGRGTLDPSGYIPEGLPPGAVFVSEITPEEEARLREEFNVE